MARWVVHGAGFVVLLGGVPLCAQTAVVPSSHAPPVYDVATVRLNTTGSGDIDVNTRPDTLRGTNWPLVDMLQSAFEVQRDMLFGLPDWARQAHYDVSAKVSEPDLAQLKALPAKERSTMLRTLLMDRFQMKWHYETRTLSDYELVVAKGGPKMTPAPANPQHSGTSARDFDLTATAITMESFARFLAQQLQRPVVDHTGLPGAFDFHLKWSPDRAVSAQDKGQDAETAPSLFTALQEQVGLRLESGKDPVQVVVFDAITPPGEN